MFVDMDQAQAYGLPPDYNMKRLLMGAFGSKEGEGAYINIRLGNARELGLRPGQDSRWADMYGGQKWKSDEPTGAGWFSGLGKESMEKSEQIYSSQNPTGITVNKPITQQSLLKKDDDKVLGRSLLGMPYIKNIPSAE